MCLLDASFVNSSFSDWISNAAVVNGGAIYAELRNFQSDSSNFSSNRAFKGGAIYSHYVTRLCVRVKNSSFR